MTGGKSALQVLLAAQTVPSPDRVRVRYENGDTLVVTLNISGRITLNDYTADRQILNKADGTVYTYTITDNRLVLTNTTTPTAA